MSSRDGWAALLEIVNHHPGADALEHLLHKLNVLRMHLVIVLGLFVGEDGVQRDLVGLIHHGPFAADHPADVKVLKAGDALEIFVSAFDQLIRRLRLRRIRPEDDDV